jgi:hypothetical protein
MPRWRGKSPHDSLGFCEVQPVPGEIRKQRPHATAKIAFNVEAFERDAGAQRDST